MMVGCVCAEVTEECCGVGVLLPLLRSYRYLTQVVKPVWQAPLPTGPSWQPLYSLFCVYVYGYLVCVCVHVFAHVHMYM